MSRFRKWVLVVVALAVVAGAGLIGARRARVWPAYLLQPKTLPLSGRLTSPDKRLALHLESFTLTGTELQIQGRLEQRTVAPGAGQGPLPGEYELRSVRLLLTSLNRRQRREPEQPFWALEAVGPAAETLVWDEGQYHQRWHFPYRRLTVQPGDELVLMLAGYRLEQKLEAEIPVAVADLAPERLPLAVPVGEAGHYVIQQVKWQGDRGGTTVVAEHRPAPELQQAVSTGLRVEFDLLWMTDEQGRRYRSVGGTARGSDGDRWVEQRTFEPIDPATVRELTLHFYQVGLSWDARGNAPPHLRFRIPE